MSADQSGPRPVSVVRTPASTARRGVTRYIRASVVSRLSRPSRSFGRLGDRDAERLAKSEAAELAPAGPPAGASSARGMLPPP